MNKVEISYKTIIFTVFFLITLFLIYQIKEIIFLVFVAFILMSAFKPWIDYLEKHRVSRVISGLSIYLLFLGLLVFLGSFIIPPFVSQTIHLVESLPNYLSPLLPFVNIDFQVVAQQIAPLGENLIKFTVGIFGNIVALFTIFVISFYLIIERGNLDEHLTSFMGEIASRWILTIVNRVEERLGAWVRGQIALMATIGVFTFVGLSILGLPYVLPLSIFAGFLEIIPTVGPIVSAIPAVLIALTVSPFYAVLIAVVYFIIQQIENQLVVPLIMKKVVGVPPLITLLALMIGAKLAGVVGAILAIPVFLTVETILSESLKLKKSR